MESIKRKEGKFETLKVLILDHGERVKLIELPDPRRELIDDFNRDWSDVGLEARVA